MGSSKLPAALEFLVDQRCEAGDAALVQALPDLAPAARSAAVAMLAERGDSPAAAGLAARFTDLSEEVQRAVLEQADRLGSALRRAITSSSLAARLSAIELIMRGRSCRNAYLLADAVRSRCPQTRSQAANALQVLTGHLLDHEGGAGSIHERSVQATCLADALRTAVLGWEIHFRPEVIEAALWMGERVEGAIRQKLQEPRTRIAHALDETLNRASDPRLAGSALRALAIPELRPSAAQAISRTEDRSFIRALMSETWLLADPRIECGCRWIRDLKWADAWCDELLKLDAPRSAGAIRLLAAMGGSPARKSEYYRELVEFGPGELRGAVLWELMGDASEAATESLAMVARCSREDVATHASRELRRRSPRAGTGVTGYQGTDGAKGGSGASRIRELPEIEEAFEEAWNRTGTEPRAAPLYSKRQGLARANSARAEARGSQTAQARTDPLAAIRAKLRSAQSLDRLEALLAVRQRGLTRAFAEQIYRAAHDPDSAARSLAVAMLAELGGATSTRILRAAVDDPDQRVQANAIEALDLLNFDKRAGCTEPKLRSPDSRVRANAVKSLLRLELRKAGDALLDMLDDPSRSHRLSALWVIERMRLQAVIQRVTDISRSDPDERIRRRAARLLRELNVASDVS